MSNNSKPVLPVPTLDDLLAETIKIPLVGQQLKLHETYLMVSFTCNCRPGSLPMLLRGQDLSIVCGNCRSIYQLTAVKFDRTVGPQVNVAVSCVGKLDAVQEG